MPTNPWRSGRRIFWIADPATENEPFVLVSGCEKGSITVGVRRYPEYRRNKPKSTVLNQIGCPQQVIRGDMEPEIEKGRVKRQRRDPL